jgi:hypothetical protein
VLAQSAAARGQVHYRRLLEMLGEAGYAVAGKKPDAVLLAQLTRSPVIRRAGRPGEYELDFDVPDRLRERLAALQSELRQLTDATAAASELGSIRNRRGRLVAELSRSERALEEAVRCLAPAADSQTDERDDAVGTANANGDAKAIQATRTEAP